jgi:hypothetical protein
MTAGVLAFALMLGQPVADPLAPPPHDECWVEPLQVSLAELAMMGRIQEQVVHRHCSRWVRADYPRFSGRRFVVARTRISDFRLFGEQLSFGFDVVVRPGGTGRPDDIYATPVLDLPEKWDRVIDKATYPALAIAGTAVITRIIVNILR